MSTHVGRGRAKSPRNTPMKKKRKERRTGVDQVLGVDIGYGMDFEVLLEEFVDFVPNENGATVTGVKYKG